MNRFAFYSGAILSIFSTFFSFSFATMPVTMTRVELSLPRLPENVSSPSNYTKEDLRCLQENMFYEARNQSDEGILMVGIVTIERTKDSHYPSTICGVVHQHAQFSWTLKKQKVKMKSKMEIDAWNHAGILAEQLLEDQNKYCNLFSSVIFYHNESVDPKWNQDINIQPEFTIGNHKFYSKVKSS
jgi:spore germination cell wall hydrolase CwlJ-like protein